MAPETIGPCLDLYYNGGYCIKCLGDNREILLQAIRLLEFDIELSYTVFLGNIHYHIDL